MPSWKKVLDEIGQVDHYQADDGATIVKGHDPRPTVRRSPECWFLTMPGSKRPRLFDTLRDAKKAHQQLSNAGGTAKYLSAAGVTKFTTEDAKRTRDVGLLIRPMASRYYFRVGYSAAEHGDLRKENPLKGTTAEKSWLAGWDAAAADDKVGHLLRPEETTL